MTAAQADSARRYRFGSVERRGILAGYRSGQVGVVAVGLVAAVVLAQLGPNGVLGGGAVLVLAVVVVAVPVGDRPLEAWAGVTAAFVLRRLVGAHRHVGGEALRGEALRGEAVRGVEAMLVRRSRPALVDPGLPAPLGRLRWMAAPWDDAVIGIVVDGWTCTGVLVARAPALTLLDEAEQDRRLAGWGSVLAGMAGDGNPVRRLQWVERTLPAGEEEIWSYLQHNRDPRLGSGDLALASYEELVTTNGSATREHESYLAVQVDLRRAQRSARRLGHGSSGPAAVLVRELEVLADRLSAADVTVVGALSPRGLANVVRAAYDPFGPRPGRDGGEGMPGLVGPVAVEAGWEHYRADGTWHTTYRIAEWPRVDVPGGFLSSLVLRTPVMRTIAVTMEVTDPLRALRSVETARTADQADEALRARHGFRLTSRRRRMVESTARREEELAEGHAEVRFAGFVTVSGRSLDELERSCAVVEHAAHQSRLDLRRLYAQQDAGFTYTLPLARGLAR